MQTDLKEGLASELKPIRVGMKDLPGAITFSQFSSISAYDDYDEEEEDVFIGDNAEQYLRKCLEQIRHFDCVIRMVRFTL